MTIELTDTKSIKNFDVQNPWGNPNPGDSKGKSPTGRDEDQKQDRSKEPLRPQFGGKRKTSQAPEDMLEKAEQFIENLFQKKSGGSGNGSNNNNDNDSGSKAPKSLIGLIILALVFIWLSSGIYKVNSDENAVVLYFGKFYSIETPGLNYHVPFPFGKVIKASVTTVNTEEFGSSHSNSAISDSLMLTGDENIVDIDFQVQWQIADIKDYIFNISGTQNSIRKTAESAMREVIARKPIASALSDGKRKIELETKDLLQEILNYYGAGVRITLVQLRKVDPPSRVIDAFRDVQTAKADKEKEINQAQSYSNDIIPRARGLAAEMEQQAEAFRQEVIANAQGEAGRFLEVYNQYSKAQRVTKKRMYLETMEKIYKNADKVFIDSSASKSGVIPYFPLNDMPKTK